MKTKAQLIVTSKIVMLNSGNWESLASLKNVYTKEIFCEPLVRKMCTKSITETSSYNLQSSHLMTVAFVWCSLEECDDQQRISVQRRFKPLTLTLLHKLYAFLKGFCCFLLVLIEINAFQKSCYNIHKNNCYIKAVILYTKKDCYL